MGVDAGQTIEYDFSLDPALVPFGETYYFRLVESDNAVFSAYTYYPKINKGGAVLWSAGAGASADSVSGGGTPATGGTAQDADPAPAVSVSDDFNRADASPVGGNWSNIQGESGMAIVSQAVVNTSAQGIYWNANTFSNDQFSQVTCVVNGSYCGSLIRYSTPITKSYYFFGKRSATTYVLGKYVNSTWTEIHLYNITPVNGDIVKIRAVGTLLTPTLNGTDLQSYSDTDLSAGAPGIHASSISTLDNWSGGNVTEDGSGGGTPASGGTGHSGGGGASP